MISFKDLLGCELYKVNRKNTLLKLGIAIVVIVIAITALCAVIKGVLGEFAYSEFGFAEENVEALKQQIAAAEASQTWLNKLLPDTSIYALKSQLAVYEYIVESGVAAGSVTAFSAGGNIPAFDYYSFTETCMSVVMAVVTIFAVVACCRATTGEYSSGALKMQFIRPINKSKFFTAKWLSVFLISEAYL
ncbi:MAG: ABC transporter permease, partial [Clostridia bacterium]|nr:ABC transporter permease [Clostridia bacterium]